MVTLLRRFVVVAALMFWQGGFVFYAAVVVPIGTKVLGSTKDQGFITRLVAEQINVAGVICLVPLAWDFVAAGDPCRWRRWIRGLAVAGMVLALGLLFWLHPQLDQLLSPEDQPHFGQAKVPGIASVVSLDTERAMGTGCYLHVADRGCLACWRFAGDGA